MMRKIHYNVMRFRDTVSLDEAEVLAGRFKSVSARYYVLHDPKKLTVPRYARFEFLVIIKSPLID